MNAVNGAQESHFGEIADADGIGEHGSISCGDAMRFFFKVKKADDPVNDVITEAKYSTFGCTSAIASSEALCAIIEQGQYTPIQALKIRNEDIVKFLEGLPSQKIHCSVMGAEALEAAVADWAQKRGVDLEALGIKLESKENEESRLVCKCFNVTEAEIRRKIVELNLHTLEDVVGALKAGGACGACQHAPGGIQDLLDERWGIGAGEIAAKAAADHGTPKLSPFQLSKRIEATIEEDIRPMLIADGGDVELIDIKENLVYISLTGACATCPGASGTIHYVVEKKLREKVDDTLRVIEV
ncbi:MAG: iron-sulfur cluster assembly scaffold protein [Proteobacteria bacterium]|nr:iron-sulfur cluster assembly scaffold protein [Pseudomonadota bacterium]